MASHPDSNPDSPPAGPSDSPEQVSPSGAPGRENVEDVPDTDGGISGSSGANRQSDTDITP
jgi:hypothetical protein